MVMLATTNSGLYKTLLVLHILSAIVGFGAVFLNALYGREVEQRKGSEGLAVFDANLFVSRIGEWFIYGVFVFGFLLVLASDDVWEFDQTWVWLSMLLYAIGIGLSHGVLWPTLRKMRGLMAEMVAGPPPGAAAPTGPPPQAAQMEVLGKRVGQVGPVLNLIVVAVLVLMVWKPGA